MAKFFVDAALVAALFVEIATETSYTLIELFAFLARANLLVLYLSSGFVSTTSEHSYQKAVKLTSGISCTYELEIRVLV